MKWQPHHLEQLRDTPLFSGLDSEQQTLVLEHTQIKRLKKGENLFNKGDAAQQFFWTREGLVKLYRLSPTGEEKIIEIVRPGQYFAEALMFGEKAKYYPVNAEMIEAGEVWCFSNKIFMEVLRGSVDTCFRLMNSMSLKLHKHINEIDRLTLQTASDRVINYLLQNKLEDSNAIQLRIPKNVLAAQLSIKPETLSRTLKKLIKDGLIETQGQNIKIIDLVALKQRACI